MRLEKKPMDGLGLEVSGGYRVGIYVIELQDNSVCKAPGLQVGDRLLKVREKKYFLDFFIVFIATCSMLTKYEIYKSFQCFVMLSKLTLLKKNRRFPKIQRKFAVPQ